MGKLVVLKIGEGSFDQGFPVTFQIGDEAQSDRLTYCPTTEVTGKLPANLELLQYYDRWRSTYSRLGLRTRLEAPRVQITNVAMLEDCDSAAQTLDERFNQWLLSEAFRPIREKWLEQLSPTDNIRLILQTQDGQIQRLPWHRWDLIERYAKAELALSLPMFERVDHSPVRHSKVKILAILGNSQGIDTQADRALLEQLPGAEVCFLVEPQRQALTDQLWAQPWDILFFAGHSSSKEAGETGQLYINDTESLTINQLRYALKKAVERGLKLAIFNSCDGLGLARELADLQIPQIIVMREPVPDRVAQTFLKNFLDIFSQGEAFYLAVRQARERLQGLEDQFPCASWLPVVCQNPAEMPPTWQELGGTVHASIPAALPPQRRQTWQQLSRIVLASLAMTTLVSGIRYLGWLQPIELAAYDQMMRSRPSEGMDPRLLIVGITEADISTQERGKGSLSDAALDRLLRKLSQLQARVIGLDVYRDYAVDPNQPSLAQQLQQASQLIATCKSSDPNNNITGIAPPPEVPAEQLGFSDFWEDPDGILRRQVLFMTPDPASPCTTPYAFSTQIAFHYLFAQGITPEFTPDGNLKLNHTTFHRLQAHQGGYHRIDAQGNQVVLNYRATDAIAPQVTLTQVLSGQVQPDAIRDRVVLIGVTADSAGDIWSTPYGSNPTKRMSGVAVQAHMVSQILSAVLDRRPLIWMWSPGYELLWIGVWACVGGGLSALMQWHSSSSHQLFLRSALLLVMASAMLYGICFGILLQGGWVPFVPALLALIATSGTVTLASPTYRLPPSKLSSEA